MNQRLRSWLFWLAIACALGLQLGTRGLHEPDEGRVAAIAREMHDAGAWWTPRLFDHAHYNKPPLLYWCLRASYAAGGVNEWTARLPAAVAALATLLLTAALGRRLFGRPAGTLAPLVLLSSPLFFAIARVIDYNMLLTCWTTLAFWAYWAWQQDGRPAQRILFHAALALAFLTKGPVGPVLVIAGVLVLRLGAPPAGGWRPIRHPLWSTLSTAAALAWPVAQALAHPELWRLFLGSELADRVVSDRFDRSEPFFFYLLMLPLALAPWLPPLLGALRDAATASRRSPAHRLIWGTCGFALLFFTLISSKMPTYILPLLPLLALAVADHLTRAPTPARIDAPLLIGLLLPIALLVAAGAIFHWPTPRLWPSFLWAAFALAGWTWRGFRAPAAAPLRAAALVVALLLAHAELCRHAGTLGPHTSARPCAEVLNQHWRAGDRVALVDRHPRGLAFYFAGPLSVSLAKFPPQIDADRPRLAGKDFTNVAEVFAAYDGTGRVFMVGSEELLNERRRDARQPVHVLYRDTRYVLFSNRPQ
jgi:4-amino-4-deoxy-L-arabinose transferase-like glycosyltransferase